MGRRGGKLSGDDELYELVLGDYLTMGIKITGATAALQHVGAEHVSALARMLVEAEDAMAEFVAGPMFLWLLSEAVQRKDERFNSREMIGTYASSRWLPVLMETEDTSFESLHPVRDPKALTIAGALLTAHTENGVEGGVVAIRRRVAEAIDARYGDGAARGFDVDGVVERMVSASGPRIDDWGFGEFWRAVDANLLANQSSGEWEEEIYEMMVGELGRLQARHAEDPEGHGEEYYDFLDSPAFVWLYEELEGRDDDRVDWEPLQFDYDESRWNPVRDAFGGHRLTPDAVQFCDAESYLAAAAELSVHFSGDNGDGVRRCVANALDRRHGPGSADRYDLDSIIDTMLEIDAQSPDDWDFGTFWMVADGQVLEPDA